MEWKQSGSKSAVSEQLTSQGRTEQMVDCTGSENAPLTQLCSTEPILWMDSIVCKRPEFIV